MDDLHDDRQASHASIADAHVRMAFPIQALQAIDIAAIGIDR